MIPKTELLARVDEEFDRHGPIVGGRRDHLRVDDVDVFEEHTTPSDCVNVASIFRSRGKPANALDWVERGLALCKKDRLSNEEHELTKMKRELLTKLGRKDDAADDAWKAFEARPSTYAYRDLMKLVPKAKRAAWHDKAMKAADESEHLFSVIELWLETKELARLVQRLRVATDEELQATGHYGLERATERIAKDHPDVAAKVYRALALRILEEKRSRQYAHALRYFGAARDAYEHAGLGGKWNELVAVVRRDHRLKRGFLERFEQVMSGSEQPSFLERARKRWTVTPE